MSFFTFQSSAVRLIELGPRIRLDLIKIEEGLQDGEVLYHKLQSKTDEEKKAIRYSERPISGRPITGKNRYTDVFVSGYQIVGHLVFRPFDNRTGYQTFVWLLIWTILSKRKCFFMTHFFVKQSSLAVRILDGRLSNGRPDIKCWQPSCF